MPTLNWIGKDEIVQHDKEVKFKLFRKLKGCSVGDKSKNLLIHGDNLEALKALIPYYQGQIKCIYIDPPLRYHCIQVGRVAQTVKNICHNKRAFTNMAGLPICPFLNSAIPATKTPIRPNKKIPFGISKIKELGNKVKVIFNIH